MTTDLQKIECSECGKLQWKTDVKMCMWCGLPCCPCEQVYNEVVDLMFCHKTCETEYLSFLRSGGDNMAKLVTTAWQQIAAIEKDNKDINLVAQIASLRIQLSMGVTNICQKLLLEPKEKTNA